MRYSDEVLRRVRELRRVGVLSGGASFDVATLVGSALREMVRAFADGADVETALQQATKTSLADLQKAKPAKLTGDGMKFASVALPKQQRQTKIVKDMPVDEIAKEIVAWIQQ